MSFFLFVKVNDISEVNHTPRRKILWEPAVYIHAFLKARPSDPIRKRYRFSETVISLTRTKKTGLGKRHVPLYVKCKLC